MKTDKPKPTTCKDCGEARLYTFLNRKTKRIYTSCVSVVCSPIQKIFMGMRKGVAKSDEMD